jgi:type I restriction enzyme S subunit
MNNLKAGYKETEVGVIPDDWEVKKLGFVGEIIRGASPRPKGDKRFYGGNVPRLMVEDVTRDGKYVYPNIDFLTIEGAKRSRPCQRGTLTIVCSGTVGVVSILGVDACIHDGFLALINILKKYLTDYLYHSLSTLRQKFNNTATHGGVFTNLTTFGVRELPIPLPPTLAEQEKIATALSDTDSYIEKLEKLIEKKKYIKTGAMQELLTGKKRLPGFGKGKGTKETPVGVIPEDWEVKKLGEVVDFTIKWSLTGGPFGSNLKSSDYCSQGVRIIQLQNIGDGKFLDSYKIYTSELKADELLSCCIYPNEIIISKMGDPVARACLIPSNSSRYLMCSDGIRLVVDKLKFSTKYVLYTINFDIFRNIANLASIGSTRKRIGLKELRFLPLPVPPTLAEQEKIATVLSDMDSEIEKLEVKLDKYKNIKQGMMQKLLTGEIRLV